MAEVFTLTRSKPAPTMQRFLYVMYDGNEMPINPTSLEIEARDLKHALQKIAAQLAYDAVDVDVWKVP